MSPGHLAAVALSPGRLAAAALSGMVAMAIGGCGGDAPPPDPVGPSVTAPSPVVAPPPTEAAWARSVMEDTYLYADRMPKVELPPDTSAARVLEALRVDPPDRFSYVDRLDRYAAFFDDGRTVGLGIGYVAQGDALVLRMVQPQSPAARAGLRRGDRIVSVDGRSVAELIAAGSVGAALGDAREGLTVRLAIERDGSRSDYAVTKASYEIAPCSPRG